MLERACQYLHYNMRQGEAVTDISEFPIAPEEALDLLFVADYMDC